MAKFKLEITETLSRDVEVEAETLEEAIAHLKKAYRNEEIILGADDFIAYGINPIDQRKDEGLNVDICFGAAIWLGACVVTGVLSAIF